jgi:ketosteroid isomerase-like protein
VIIDKSVMGAAGFEPATSGPIGVGLGTSAWLVLKHCSPASVRWVGSDPVDVVRSVYEAFAAADADRIADHLHADVELIDPDLPGGGTFSGIAGVFEFLRLWGEGFNELHIEVEELIPMDDRVVAVVHQHGVAETSGVPVDMHDAHLWIVEDGLVKRIQLFLSRDAALTAAQSS